MKERKDFQSTALSYFGSHISLEMGEFHSQRIHEYHVYILNEMNKIY